MWPRLANQATAGDQPWLWLSSVNLDDRMTTDDDLHMHMRELFRIAKLGQAWPRAQAWPGRGLSYRTAVYWRAMRCRGRISAIRSIQALAFAFHGIPRNSTSCTSLRLCATARFAIASTTQRHVLHGERNVPSMKPNPHSEENSPSSQKQHRYTHAAAAVSGCGKLGQIA